MFHRNRLTYSSVKSKSRIPEIALLIRVKQGASAGIPVDFQVNQSSAQPKKKLCVRYYVFIKGKMQWIQDDTTIKMNHLHKHDNTLV